MANLAEVLEGLGPERATKVMELLDSMHQAWGLPRAQMASLETAAWMLLHIREEIALHMKRIAAIEGVDSKWLSWLIEFDRRFELWGEHLLTTMAETVAECAPKDTL